MNRKSFVAAALGTLIEYYDYALFAIFLPIMAPLFFPAATAYQSLVKGYFVLLITMLARPLGGLAFGYIGDFFGRRKALLASMYGIALATFVIGITPSYASWGIASVVIIILAKSLQLFFFGGEYNGAGIYVVEHAQNKRPAFMGSLLTASTLAGALLASLFGIILTADFMPTWSWRIAFVLGGIIGVLGIIYRKNLAESPHFQAATKSQQSIVVMLKQFSREFVAGIFIGALATIPFTTVLLFITPVLVTKNHLSNQQFMMLQTILILVAIITLMIAGALADKKSPSKVMQWSCWALILLSYPLLLMVDSGHFYFIIPALMILIIINEFLLGPSNAYLKKLFPMQYCYRGVSFSVCLGMAVLGGLTPIIENYLFQWGGGFFAISIWLITIASLGLWALKVVSKYKNISQDDVIICNPP